MAPAHGIHGTFAALLGGGDGDQKSAPKEVLIFFACVNFDCRGGCGAVFWLTWPQISCPGTFEHVIYSVFTLVGPQKGLLGTGHRNLTHIEVFEN